MTVAACAMVMALTLGPGAAADTSTRVSSDRTATPIAAAVQAPVLREAVVKPALLERWQMDVRQTRPAALPVMYAAFGALQVADIYSTRRALGGNAYEANSIMRAASKNAGAMLAVKALSTVGTIYFTERAWKKNRKTAVILMAVINGVTAAVTANNLRVARR